MVKANKISVFHVIGGEYNTSDVKDKYFSPAYNTHTNFLYKHMSIVMRILYVNSLIDKLFDTWACIINEPKPPANLQTNQTALCEFIIQHSQWQEKCIISLFEQEEFITQLRKITDECISLYSIDKNILKPNGRPYEGVDELLRPIKKGDNKLFKDLLSYKDYFITLNNVSKGFKHCVANNITQHIGRDEPCIFIYYNNSRTQQVDFAGIAVNKIVAMFNDFYNYFNSIITKRAS